MELQCEVVHRWNDRVFDLESYERTGQFRELMRDRDSGYYVLISTSDLSNGVGGDIRVLGPFLDELAASASAVAP